MEGWGESGEVGIRTRQKGLGEGEGKGVSGRGGRWREGWGREGVGGRGGRKEGRGVKGDRKWPEWDAVARAAGKDMVGVGKGDLVIPVTSARVGA